MDGRRPAGILYVESDVAAPHGREEYRRWYLGVHFAEVTGPGVFVDPLLFRNARDPLPAGEAHFLALYETARHDLEAAMAEFERHVERLFARRRIHPGTAGGLYGAYRLLARRTAEGRQRTQSAVAVHLDAEPGSESALRSWGQAELLPGAEALGLFHTGSFLERADGGTFADAIPPDAPRFLALFESDRGGPAALAGALSRKLLGAPPGILRRVSSFYRSSP